MALTIDDLRALVDYHCWARARVLDALERLTPEQYTRDLGSSFKSIDGFDRVLSAARVIA